MLSRPLPLALLALIASCASTLPRRPDAVRLAPHGPLARYRDELLAGDPSTGSHTRAALHELEDLVEPAASRLCGEELDAPTPEVSDSLLLVLARERRPPGDLRSWGYLSGPHRYAHPLGLKYVADHAGPSWRRALSDPRSDLVAAVVADAVTGRVPLRESLRALRQAEKPLWSALGLKERDLEHNAARYDTAVGHAAGLTYRKRTWLGTRPAILLARSELEGDPGHLVATYGHELMHVLLDTGPLDPDALRVEEAFCQAFGRRLSAELSQRGALGAPPHPDPDEPRPARPDERAALERLALLYHARGLRFEAPARVRTLYDTAPEAARAPSLVAVFTRLLERDGVPATLERVRRGSSPAALRAAL